MRYIIFGLLSFITIANLTLSASIVNTRHNLSTSNSVVPLDVNDTIIKATAETEICVFCHVPHSINPVGLPLWNRSMNESDYTLYNSDYLRRINYPVATNLGVANNTPGALSRQCLSCHDGTIAVGAVHKLRMDLNSPVIDMSGVDGTGMIPDTKAGFIGTTLTKHHPIGIEYDTTPSVTFGDGSTRDIELTFDTSSPIKLFEYPDYPGKKYVECSSCHDPHKEGNNVGGESNKFLRVDTEGSLGANFYKTCTSCHSKTDWASGGPNSGPSVHHSPPGDPSYVDADGKVLEEYGTTKISEMGCANCHVPHNGGADAYLNRQAMAATCFQGAANSEANANCHGVGGVKDIQTIVENKSYAHPISEGLTGDSNHTNLDVLYGYNMVDTVSVETVDSGGVGGMSWGTNKHAMCMDCHNPHRARAGTHSENYTGYNVATAPYGTSRTLTEANNANKVSPALNGVTGVEPTWPSEWTQPQAFTTKESAEFEYQICFKCHSYYGLGPTQSTVNPVTTYVSPSGALISDVAWEMNKNNKSGHPVVFPNNATGRPGSYAPQELLDVQLLSPWKDNPGQNTMYCSDCHGNDTELGGDPKGPHGSNLLYLLKGVNQYWPKNASGVLYTMDDIGTVTDEGIICKNCHDIAYPHSIWLQKMAGKGFTCITCHLVVPHGSPVSRLLGYHTFPEPYNYGGNSLALYGYRKVDVANPSNKDAHSLFDNGTFKCSGGTCHTTDDSANGAYDANLLP